MNVIAIDSAWWLLIMGNFVNEGNLQSDIGNCLIAVGTLLRIFPPSPYLCAEEVTISIAR